MKTLFLMAWAAVLPVLAQSPTPPTPATPPAPAADGAVCPPCCTPCPAASPCCGDKAPACKADFSKKMLERFDANKDGQLDEQERAAMKAARHDGKGKGHGDRGRCGMKDKAGAPPAKGACPAKKGCPAPPAAPADAAAPAESTAAPAAPEVTPEAEPAA